jgi:hypothetical protein
LRRIVDNETENTPGQEPNDDDALGGGREQDDQQADDGVDPEVRRLRAEAKRLRLERNELRTKTKAYEDRDKTDEQRRQDELSAASKRAEAAEQRLLRFEVAAELGISQHASRLQGDTREALVADAKALAKEFGLDNAGNGAPPPNFSSGVRRPVQRTTKTMNDVILRASGR